MPLRHSCHAVLRVPKRANRAVQYKGGIPIKQRRIPEQYYYKSSLHSVFQSAGCFCADYQIRCSQ